MKIQSIIIAINNRCFSRCTTCAAKSTPTSEMTMSLASFGHHVRQAKELGAESLILSGGEPLLHPEIESIIVTAKEAGFEDVVIFSGDWSKGESQTRAPLLNTLFREYSDILDLQITFHPFRDNGIQTKVRESWQATVEGFLSFAPLMKIVPGQKDRLVWKMGLPPSPGFGPIRKSPHIDLLVEIAKGLNGSSFIGENGRVFSFPEQDLQVLLAPFLYGPFGRGEEVQQELGLPATKHCDSTISDDPWPTTPYISPDNYMRPCGSTVNFDPERRTGTVNVSLENGVSHEEALLRFQAIKPHLARLKDGKRAMPSLQDFSDILPGLSPGFEEALREIQSLQAESDRLGAMSSMLKDDGSVRGLLFADPDLSICSMCAELRKLVSTTPSHVLRGMM